MYTLHRGLGILLGATCSDMQHYPQRSAASCTLLLVARLLRPAARIPAWTKFSACAAKAESNKGVIAGKVPSRRVMWDGCVTPCHVEPALGRPAALGWSVVMIQICMRHMWLLPELLGRRPADFLWWDLGWVWGGGRGRAFWLRCLL